MWISDTSCSSVCFFGNDNVKAADAAGEATLGAATIEPEILFGNGKIDNVAIKSLTTNGSNYGTITKGTDYFTGFNRSGDDSTQRAFRGRKDTIFYLGNFENGAYIEFTLNPAQI